MTKGHTQVTQEGLWFWLSSMNAIITLSTYCENPECWHEWNLTWGSVCVGVDWRSVQGKNLVLAAESRWKVVLITGIWAWEETYVDPKRRRRAIPLAWCCMKSNVYKGCFFQNAGSTKVSVTLKIKVCFSQVKKATGGKSSKTQTTTTTSTQGGKTIITKRILETVDGKQNQVGRWTTGIQNDPPTTFNYVTT